MLNKAFTGPTDFKIMRAIADAIYFNAKVAKDREEDAKTTLCETLRSLRLDQYTLCFEIVCDEVLSARNKKKIPPKRDRFFNYL
jgi:hypothetical protein